MPIMRRRHASTDSVVAAAAGNAASRRADLPLVDGRILSGIDTMAAIVARGSFVGAAETLHLTQSGVSRAVARLEERLGVRLFDRTSRAVRLTDEGRRFFERVAPLLGGIEEAACDAAGSSTRVRGQLRVNVDASFLGLVLAPRLGAFLGAHPELEVEVVVHEALGDLVGDGFDAAVRFGVPKPSSLVHRVLLTTRILTCAAPAYLDRRGRPRHPRDLRDHECIYFRDPTSGRPFEWVLQRGEEVIDVAAKGRLVVNDLWAKIVVCGAGYGLAQFVDIGVAEQLADGTLEQILPTWADEEFPLCVYYPSRQLPPAKVRAFVDFVVEATAGADEAARRRRRRPSAARARPQKLLLSGGDTVKAEAADPEGRRSRARAGGSPGS